MIYMFVSKSTHLSACLSRSVIKINNNYNKYAIIMMSSLQLNHFFFSLYVMRLFYEI